MLNFWLIFGLVGIIWIPVLLLFAICGADAKHRIGGSIVAIFFWLIMSFGLYTQTTENNKNWNDGNCDKCEIHWELVAVTKTRNGSTTKYYTCPKCYKEIEIIS